jgi:hypothetical protein
MKNVLVEEQPLYNSIITYAPVVAERKRDLVEGEQLFKLVSLHLTAMGQRATGAHWFPRHFTLTPSWTDGLSLSVSVKLNPLSETSVFDGYNLRDVNGFEFHIMLHLFKDLMFVS